MRQNNLWRSLLTASFSLFVAVTSVNADVPVEFTRGRSQNPNDLVLLIDGEPFHTRLREGEFAALSFEKRDIVTASIISGPANNGCFLSAAIDVFDTDFVSSTIYTRSSIDVLLGSVGAVGTPINVLDQPFPNAQFAICFNMGANKDPNQTAILWYQSSNIGGRGRGRGTGPASSATRIQHLLIDFSPPGVRRQFVTLEWDEQRTVDRATIVHGPPTAKGAVVSDLRERRIAKFTQQQPMLVPFERASVIGCGEATTDEELAFFGEEI